MTDIYDDFAKQVSQPRTISKPKVLGASYSFSGLDRYALRTFLATVNREHLAEQLHKMYRAANKALFSAEGYTEGGKHDHGWTKCHKKEYFRNRAEILLKELL